MAVVLLLIPIIGLELVHKIVFKLLIIFMAAAIFVISVSAFGGAGMGEVFVAGATYAAVLVVFISGSGP
jgi:hypothetical protein